MKCKHCNGTGITNWCINGTFKECPYCGGIGEVDRFNAVDVLKVMEMVKKPHTNEEWIHTLNTEQLAEFLIASIKKCKSCASGIGFDEVQHCPFGECGCHFKGEVVAWLKQPHTDKE